MRHLAFVDETVNMGLAIQGSYDLPLVLVSYVIAVLAASVALNLSSVITATAKSLTRYAWIGAGSVAMGIGVWAMHFIGMLAYILPMSVVYEPITTLISMLPAIFASAVMLDVISRPRLGKARLITGGILMGGGIGAMHYTGMAAMRMDASMLYDPVLFVMSLVVAVVLAMLALYIKFLSEQNNSQHLTWVKFLSPMAMGMAIAGMHYTAMFAVYYFPNGGNVIITGLDPLWLASLIGVATFLILSLALLATFAGNQLAAKKQLAIEVSKRREAEEALIKVADGLELRIAEQTVDIQKSEARLKAVFETLTEGLITIDNKGNIEDFNPSAERLFGYGKAEVIGMNVKMLMPDPYKSEHDGHLANYLNTGEDKIIGIGREVTGQRKDSTTFPMDLSVAEIKLGDHRFFTGIVRDITERKLAEQELIITKEAAEKANRAKSEFLSRMSHELRTPLNAIVGFSQLLEMKELDKMERESVAHILKAGRHLTDLINEVLDIARIESGRQNMSPEPVHVLSLLEDAWSLMRPLADERSIKLKNDIPEECNSHVLADLQRLKQVLLNLMSNAIKYNHDGGTVQLTCTEVRNGIIRISLTDTGLGIAEENYERIFEPYERLNADESGIEGSGVGLALSKALVEAMGGILRLDSKLGVGSTFWIELPLMGEIAKQDYVREANQGIAELPEAGQTEPVTLLYIEDNIANFRLVEVVLSNRPHIELIAAMEGELGIDLALRQKPDMILLDLHLPGLMGDKVLARLKAHPETQQIPVVIISADATKRQIEKLLVAGAYAYLTKPFNIKELLHTIDAVLESRPDNNTDHSEL